MKKVIIICIIAVVAALIAYGVVWWYGERIKDEEARQRRESFDAQYNKERAVKEKLDEVNKRIDRNYKK